MRISPLVPLLVAALLAATPFTADAKRVALVIGNANYGSGLSLKNPCNDAKRIAEGLQKLDFTVMVGLDLNKQLMDDAILEFSRSLSRGDVAWFFYSGHGLQVDNTNYLLPVGSDAREAFEVKQKAVEIDHVRSAIGSSGVQLSVLVLDCCRDNPFERKWTRSVTRGLAPILIKPEGEIIAFATDANSVAQDGDGNNSPFTEQLASVLESRPPEGLEVKDVFFRTGLGMKKRYDQRPKIEMDAAIEKFYLDRNSSGALTSGSEGRQMPFLASATPSAGIVPQSSLRTLEPLAIPMPALQQDLVAPPGGVKTADAVFSQSSYRQYNDYTKRLILKKAQESMLKAGIYKSSVDGSMGPGTARAILAWQQSNGLPSHGYLDDQTLQSMHLTGLAEQPAPQKAPRQTTVTRRTPSAPSNDFNFLRDVVVPGAVLYKALR